MPRSGCSGLRGVNPNEQKIKFQESLIFELTYLLLIKIRKQNAANKDCWQSMSFFIQLFFFCYVTKYINEHHILFPNNILFFALLFKGFSCSARKSAIKIRHLYILFLKTKKKIRLAESSQNLNSLLVFVLWT